MGDRCLMYYIVEKGDCLSRIDRDWRATYERNRDVIGSNPDLILPGQEICLSDQAGGGAEDAEDAETKKEVIATLRYVSKTLSDLSDESDRLYFEAMKISGGGTDVQLDARGRILRILRVSGESGERCKARAKPDKRTQELTVVDETGDGVPDSYVCTQGPPWKEEPPSARQALLFKELQPLVADAFSHLRDVDALLLMCGKDEYSTSCTKWSPKSSLFLDDEPFPVSIEIWRGNGDGNMSFRSSKYGKIVVGVPNKMLRGMAIYRKLVD